MAGIDPTPTELTPMTTLDLIGDWVGVADTTTAPFRARLMGALGNPTMIREVALMDKALWDATTAAITTIDTHKMVVLGRDYESFNILTWSARPFWLKRALAGRPGGILFFPTLDHPCPKVLVPLG